MSTLTKIIDDLLTTEYHWNLPCVKAFIDRSISRNGTIPNRGFDLIIIKFLNEDIFQISFEISIL